LRRRGGVCDCLCRAGGPAFAQAYPAKPVTVILPLAAGTGVDVVARLFSERLSQRLGQPFVVENRPGAAQMIAMDSVLKAPPDGYVIGVATSSAMAIRPSMLKKPPYDPLRDFVPIANYLKSPFAVIVNPGLPVHSVADLIRHAKENPGKLSYASSSIGAAPHLTGEYLQQRFGFKMSNVPYKVSPQAFADVAAGHVPLSVADVGTALPLIKAGKVRALAVTSTARLPTLPDVPTLAEATKTDFEAVSWHVLFARAQVPEDIVGRLHGEMKAIMADPAVTARIAELGLLPHPVPSVAETRAYIKAEIEKWGRLIQSLGLAGTI
jgi:tripartite-type tricarboxylate transporter receptor subunit TctC